MFLLLRAGKWLPMMYFNFVERFNAFIECKVRGKHAKTILANRLAVLGAGKNLG